MKDSSNDKYHDDSEWKEWADDVIENGTDEDWDKLLASIGIMTKKRRQKLEKLFRQYRKQIEWAVNYELPPKGNNK